MTQVHEANYKPNARKPKKDWTRSPEEEATYQKMLAKCQKNANHGSSGADSEARSVGLTSSQKHGACSGERSASEIAQAGCNSPPAVSPQLHWEKPEKGATGVKTTCKRYSCSKVTVCGKQSYELWVLVPGVWFRQLAVGLESFSKAQEVAEQHLREKGI